MAKERDLAQPRSAGYRIFHSILCVLGTLLLLLCLSGTAAMRYYINHDTLVNAVRDAKLSDTKIPFTGKTVAEYIKQDYVQDDQVLQLDVAYAVDEMGIPAFLAQKLDGWFAMLRGDSETVMTVQPDEIIDLLDNSRATLYDKCLLVIEDSDLEQVRSETESTLTTINGAALAMYGSKAGRLFARFRVSVWRMVLDAVLLVLLLLRWREIMKNSGEQPGKALRIMGWTAAVPCGIAVIGLLIGGVGSLFVRDNVVGIYGVTKALRTPHWAIAILGTAIGAFLIFLGRYMIYRANRPKEAALEQRLTPPAEIPTRPARPAASPAEQPAVRRTAAAAAPESANEPKRYCIHCGKELVKSARFCIYCGTNQETGGDAVEEILKETLGEDKKTEKIDLSKTTELP